MARKPPKVISYLSHGYKPPKKKAAALPGDPNWAQAAQYGWTGSPDPGVVWQADQPETPGDIDVQVPGLPFDYFTAISGDPEYQQAEREMGLANAADRLRLTNLRRQALIDLGVVPGGLEGEALTDIDEATRGLAAANPQSAFAQAGQARARNLAQLRANLGVRGGLQSGAYVGGQQRAQQAYETTTNLATRSTLASLAEALSGYTGGVETRAGNLRGLGSNVAARLQQDPRYQPRTVRAIWDPAVGAYRSPSGGLYDASGNKVG